MFIKLCGFTRNEDIEAVKKFPVSAVGFIFYKNSRRYVTPERAAEMSALLSGSGIKTVGVFVDDRPEEIMATMKFSHLDMVQVYSSNTANVLAPAVPLIICVRIGAPGQNILPEPHNGGMILFDTYSDQAHGGTGISFNLNLVRDYPHKERMILAGGLNESNIRQIIKEIRPGGIDISSGIEISPGIKSEKKIAGIMQAIEEASDDTNA